MADTSNLSQFLTDVADAIRTKKETTEQIPAENFDQEILSIETGTEINNQDKEVTENGTYTADEGYTGLGTVTVNVPQEGGSGDIKLFETEEEMQADTTAEEGDLAVVYRSEVQNATVDSEFQTATFPDTVVLDNAITDYVEVRYRAVDSSKMFDCWGSLDNSRFRMDCYTESGEIRIEYRSSDGITYTRTDSTGNPIDFGTEIYYERPERWNDAIGKFIQCNGNTFEGLYKAESKLTHTVNYNYRLENGEVKYDSVEYDFDQLYEDLRLSHSNGSNLKLVSNYAEGKPTRYWYSAYAGQCLIHYNGHIYFGFATSSDITDNYCVCYRDIGGSDVYPDISTATKVTINSTNYYIFTTSQTVDDISVRYFCDNAGNESYPMYYIENNTVYNIPIVANTGNYYLQWVLAPTQLTLSNSNELLPGKIAYGKNGAVTGDESVYDNLSPTELLDKTLNSSGFIDNINARGNIPVLDNRVLHYLKFTDNGEYTIGKCVQNEPDVNYVYKNKSITVKCYLSYFVVYNGEDIIYDFRTEADYTDEFRIIPTTEVNHRITLTLRTGSQDGYNKDRIMQINLETGNVTTLCKRGDLVLEHCDTFSTNSGNSYGYLMDSRYAYLYISKYSSSAPYYVGTRLYLYDTMLDKSAEINFEAPVEQVYSGFGDILPYQTDKALYLLLKSISNYKLYRMDKNTGEFTLFDERSNYYSLSNAQSYIKLNSLIEDDNYFYYIEYGQIKKVSKSTMTVENTLTTNLPSGYEYTLDNKLYYATNYSTIHVFTVNITETELTITEIDTVNVSDVDFDYINNDCVITKPFKNVTSEGSVNIKMYRCSETNINDYDLAVLGYNLGTNNNQKLHILQNSFYTDTISPEEYNTALETAQDILGKEVTE